MGLKLSGDSFSLGLVVRPDHRDGFAEISHAHAQRNRAVFDQCGSPVRSLYRSLAASSPQPAAVTRHSKVKASTNGMVHSNSQARLILTADQVVNEPSDKDDRDGKEDGPNVASDCFCQPSHNQKSSAVFASMNKTVRHEA